MSQAKDVEITYQLASWAKQHDLGKINLLYCQLKIELDGEKQTKTKSPASHTLFPRLNFTPSLQTPLLPSCYRHKLRSVHSVRQQGLEGAIMVSTQWFLSAASSFLNFPSAPAWGLHRPVPLGISICSSTLHRLQWISAVPWSTSSFSSHLSVISTVCHPFPPLLLLTFSACSWICFHRHHWLGWWAQLCPVVGPFWSQLSLAWGGSWSQPIEATLQPPPCHLHPIQGFTYMIQYNQMAAQTPLLLLPVVFKQAAFTFPDTPYLQQINLQRSAHLC